ncbi:unnamed protein product [Urochloa decumbens]|uniref:F-box domain-containing protein n=1 Tax=Urochloa decumbens TaxID=240449 RepID=A0ABC9AND1_9POAL
MPPGSKVRSRERSATARGPDRLSALPDKVLQRLLFFLPSREAVRTCMLASRWRHVWKSMQALRVTNVDDYRSASHLNKFINSFLLLREPLPLLEVEIGSHTDGEGDDDVEPLQYMELWIECGLSSDAGVLRVFNKYTVRLILRDGLITSKNLKVLELYHVEVDSLHIDFSSCPALEDLRMKLCYFKAFMIISPSVKRLSITCPEFEIRSRISAPNLIFLELADCHGRIPLLENMPMLTSAFVRLQTDSDGCANKYETGDCGSCEGCCDSNIGSNTSVLLEALSGCMNLELTALASKFIFRKDLTLCPVFSKLKTLLLSEWCVTANLGALICFLQHSPVLEKLTLQFPEILEDLVGTGASYGTLKEPFSLEHLTVEVKCQNADDKGIRKILELLDFYGVPSEQIKIQQPPKIIELEEFDEYYDNQQPSLSFSFEQQMTSQDVDEATSSDSWDSNDESTSSDSSDSTD